MTPTKDMVFCGKHWPVNCKIYKEKVNQVPVVPPSFLSTLFCQNLDASPQNPERSHIDHEH